jgi:sugar/nucleoside kinase (ribokinase family)
MPPSPENSTPDVIVYGTVCLDILMRVGADGKPLSEPSAFPGGEAFNTATALSGWGLNVLLTGTAIGSDSEGDILRHLLDTHPLGLSRTYIPDVPTAVTPVCQVKITEDGERSMSGRGFREAVVPPPLPESLFKHRPIFATDPNLGEAAIRETLRAAARGCPVVAMDLSHVLEVVAVSRIVIESEERIRRLNLSDPPEALVVRWVEEGAQTAIITRGASGCLVADRVEGLFSVPAFAVDPIIDTTGAGDTFRAGLCYGLHRELPLGEALRFACAAAARHCQVLGGGSRVPLSEIYALLHT